MKRHSLLFKANTNTSCLWNLSFFFLTKMVFCSFILTEMLLFPGSWEAESGGQGGRQPVILITVLLFHEDPWPSLSSYGHLHHIVWASYFLTCWLQPILRAWVQTCSCICIWDTGSSCSSFITYVILLLLLLLLKEKEKKKIYLKESLTFQNGNDGWDWAKPDMSLKFHLGLSSTWQGPK